MKLVMVRHGQSVWNKENRFTGWIDVDLSEQGLQEAQDAGELLKRHGFSFDLAFTSVLKRANRTLEEILKVLGESDIEIKRSWRLNERHYGALQGLNKDDMRAQYGAEQVHIWRRSADVRPPALTEEDERYPGNDPKYKELTKEQLPLTENLLDTVDRVVPFWDSDIKPALLSGRSVIVAAHGNSLRSLVKYIEGMAPEEIIKVEIPTGRPLVYELDENLNFVSKAYLE